MKKTLKILAVVLGILLLGVSALTVIIKVKFPPDKLTALANEQAKKYLRREIKLTSISIGLFRGLALEGFELSESPSFSAGRFVSSRSLSVKPFLLPLLKGEVVVKSIDLRSPEIRIVRYRDGTFNFSDLTATEAAPEEAKTKEPAASTPKIFVNHLAIDNGSLAFEDHSAAKMNVGVKALNLSVDSFSFLTPFRIEMACAVDGAIQGKPLSGRLSYEGQVSVLNQEVEIRQLKIEMLKTVVKAEGSIKNFSDPAADLKLKIESFDPQSLAPFVAIPPQLSDASMSGDLNIKGGMKKLTVDGKLKGGAMGARTNLDLKVGVDAPTEDISFDASVGFSDLNIEKSPALPEISISGPLNGEIRAKGKAAAFTGDVKVDGEKAVIKYGTMATKAAGGTLRVTATSQLKDPFDNPSFQASGEVGKLVLGSGPPMPPEVKLSGPVSLKFNAKGTVRAVSVDVDINADEATFQYGAVAAKEAASETRLTAKVSLAEPYDNPTIDAKGRIGKLMLSPGAPLPADLKVSGPVGVNFSAKGTMANLGATIDVQAKDLSVSYGKTFSKPAGAPMSFAGDIVLKNQKDLKINSSRFALDPLVLNTRGTVADATGAGQLDIKMEAPPFALDPLAGMIPLMKEYKLTGKTGLNLAATGTFAAPKAEGSLSMKGMGATPMEGVVFNDLNGTLNFTENTAETKDLKGKFNGSDISFKFRAENFARPTVSLEGELAQLDAGALMKTFMGPTQPTPAESAPTPPAPGPAPIAKTEGSFRVGSIVHPNYDGRQFKLEWNLTDVGPYMGNSNGSANFSAADGKIHDLPLAKKINKLLKKDASEIPYEKMTGHFTVTKGILETPDFTVNSALADILAKGTVNLVSMAADMRIIMRGQKGAFGGSAEEWFADEDGRPTLEATVKGPLSDPSIQPDLSKAAKRAAEDAARKGLEKLKEKFGGGEQKEGTAEEPSKQEKQIDKALEEGQKALDKLFKKKK